MFKKNRIISKGMILLLLIIFFILSYSIYNSKIKNNSMVNTSISRENQILSENSPISNKEGNSNMNIIVILGLIMGLMILFFWEPIRLDLISLSIPVILIILQPWTNLTVQDALSGFFQ